MQKIRYLDKLVDELAKGKADGEDPARVTIMPAPKSRVRTRRRVLHQAWARWKR